MYPPETTFGAHFGTRIVQHDDVLYVSAPGTGHFQTQDNLYTGKIYCYEIDENSFIINSIIESSDNEPFDNFGSTFAFFNESLAVSAYKNQDGGAASGSVYLFELIDNTWQETNKIISSDLETGDNFGFSLALLENDLIVSAPMKNNLTGAVYAYDPNNTSLHSNFAADVRSGEGPLTVQFTSVPQGEVLAYEWDFNSDGFIDSTEPHPEFTYEINGIYDVTLTVYDAEGSDSQTKEEYIQVVSDVLFGDVNVDGVLDVLDLVTYINIILGVTEPEEHQFLSGDVNFSGEIDILDVVMVVDEIIH